VQGGHPSEPANEQERCIDGFEPARRRVAGPVRPCSWSPNHRRALKNSRISVTSAVGSSMAAK
jgi:hypothetical protein